MGMFGLFEPNIAKMMRERDVDGLIRLLSCKDVDLGKKAAEALASLLIMKTSKPGTLNEVKEMLGRDAARFFSFSQEGDRVYVKRKDWGKSMPREVFISISQRAKDLGGNYDHGVFEIPLYKPPLAPTPAREHGKPIYLEKKEKAAEELGKFGDDLALEPLVEYANSSPLTAIRAISNIRSARANEALRMMLLKEYRSHLPGYVEAEASRSTWRCDPEMKSVYVLEEALIDHGDYEGCKEIIRVYYRLIEDKKYDAESVSYSWSRPSRDLIYRAIKSIIEKHEVRGDKELLMIILKSLGAFPADFSGLWYEHYFAWEIQDGSINGDLYGLSFVNILGKKLQLDLIKPAGWRGFLPITLEGFKEYLLSLDLEILGDEEVLNHMVTLITEYPNTLENNPIAAALQRVELDKKIPFLKKYLQTCEDEPAKDLHILKKKVGRGEYGRNVQSYLEQVIKSLRYWLSFWEDDNTKRKN